jgi:hypothetical protein
MMAPRVTPLEGVSTYAPQGIRVRGVENPQGFGIDERRLNALSEDIIGAAFEVSNVPGVSFLEKVYENALNIELNLRGLKTLQQVPIKEIDTVHFAQRLNYLRITGLKLCLLIRNYKISAAR